jgi:hypothetical protein
LTLLATSAVAPLGVIAIILPLRNTTAMPRLLTALMLLCTTAFGVLLMRANARRLPMLGEDVLAEALSASLAPRSLWLIERDSLWSNAQAEWSQTRTRPDVKIAAMASFDANADTNRLLRGMPELLPVVRGYLYQGALPLTELQNLAASRALYLSSPAQPNGLSNAKDGTALNRLLLPEGLLYRVSAEGFSNSEAVSSAELADARTQKLLAALTRTGIPRLSKERLGRTMREQVAYYVDVDDQEHALAALQLAEQLSPNDPELPAIHAQLMGGIRSD